MLVDLIINGFLTVVALLFVILAWKHRANAERLALELEEAEFLCKNASESLCTRETDLARVKSELADAQKRLDEAQKDHARVERNLKNLCHGFGVPVKREYSDQDLAAFGRKAKLRAQLGPEINYIFRTAAKRGLV